MTGRLKPRTIRLASDKRAFLLKQVRKSNKSYSARQHYIKNNDVVLTGLTHLATSGMSKLERSLKGKIWSKHTKTDKSIKWASWGKTLHLAFKMGLIPQHEI